MVSGPPGGATIFKTEMQQKHTWLDKADEEKPSQNSDKKWVFTDWTLSAPLFPAVNEWTMLVANELANPVLATI